MNNITHATMQNDRKIRVACIGDSITTGYGLADPRKQCFPAVLRRMLGRGYAVRAFGANGATVLGSIPSSYARTDECRRALEFRADIVVVELGTNDLLHIRDNEVEFIHDYDILLDAILADVPDTKILVTSLAPILTDIPGFSKEDMRIRHGVIQKMLEWIAALRNLPFVDICSRLESNYACNKHLLPDSIHPNRFGAELIALSVYLAIMAITDE